MRLGKRLSSLNQVVSKSYEAIWDCCCDHGLLGMALLHRGVAQKVYFVDRLHLPMEKLTVQLAEHFSEPECSWEVFCCDLKSIELPQKDNQLFIIAGVGGDKTIEFVQSICGKANSLVIDFLICSVHGNYQIRESLIKLGFKLVSEAIVKENRRFYELIYVSRNEGRVLTKAGSQMWNWENPEHHEYLQKTINHFSKKAKVDPLKYGALLAEYQNLCIK